MSWEQVAAVALKVGWTPGQATIATAITGNESARYPAIIQQGQPYATTGWGLWQITPGDSVPQFGINYALLDPVNNGKAAKWKFDQAHGWSPWYADLFGIYQAYLPYAEPAVAKVAKLPLSELDRLVKDAQRGVGSGDVGSSQVSDWSPTIRNGARHLGRTARQLHAHGLAVAQLRAQLRPPAVAVPDPSTLLWVPGQGAPESS